jgi:Cu-processing system permease protein
MTTFDVRAVAIVARKEFRERLRNRWVLVIGGVFCAFALAIAWFGAAQQGSLGFRGIEVTIASLTSLVIYLLPLIALILGYDAVVGERERGSLDLLLSLPLTRAELLAGKYCGLALALATATIGGFGAAGMALAGDITRQDLVHYVGFVASALLLGLAFLSLAVLTSVWARDRASASGVAIGLWFFFVLVFDLVLMAVLVAGGGETGAAVFPYLLLLDPTDVFRILNIFRLEEARSYYGLATVFPERLSNPAVLGAWMLVWILGPLGLALWRFE